MTSLDTPHALYRFYDRDDRLLYVGLTSDPGRRWKDHERGKSWWHEVARVELDKFPSRSTVAAAEREAIERERPLYNIQHREKSPTSPTADALAWPPCPCGKPASLWGVDDVACETYASAKRKAVNDHGRVNVSTFLRNQPPRWWTICWDCYNARPSAFYFEIGVWQETLRHVAHLVDTKPRLLTNSLLGPLLYSITNRRWCPACGTPAVYNNQTDLYDHLTPSGTEPAPRRCQLINVRGTSTYDPYTGERATR